MKTRGRGSSGGTCRERKKGKRRVGESSTQRYLEPNLISTKLRPVQPQFIDKDAEERYLVFVKKNVIIQRVCVYKT